MQLSSISNPWSRVHWFFVYVSPCQMYGWAAAEMGNHYYHDGTANFCKCHGCLFEKEPLRTTQTVARSCTTLDEPLRTYFECGFEIETLHTYTHHCSIVGSLVRSCLQLMVSVMVADLARVAAIGRSPFRFPFTPREYSRTRRRPRPTVACRRRSRCA
jgi:hypothetical protein